MGLGSRVYSSGCMKPAATLCSCASILFGNTSSSASSVKIRKIEGEWGKIKKWGGAAKSGETVDGK